MNLPPEQERHLFDVMLRNCPARHELESEVHQHISRRSTKKYVPILEICSKGSRGTLEIFGLSVSNQLQAASCRQAAEGVCRVTGAPSQFLKSQLLRLILEKDSLFRLSKENIP